ncbi:Zinc finger protein 26 [Folsomia candida]|uniref:Zinc finger protein 26 n=1 Tax=Folsomia candida TaxID=158441 RepID=A0A226DHX3_FOLCA|nr:Zinc finger protein 26 [Folsomia candida]
MNLTPRKTFECPKCFKTYKFKSKFTSHLIRHEPKVKCKICGKISKNPVALSKHIRNLHTNRERPSCALCRREFHDPVALRKHIKVIHGTSERPRLPCGFLGCEKTFLDKYQVSQHVITDHAENRSDIRAHFVEKNSKRKDTLRATFPPTRRRSRLSVQTVGLVSPADETLKKVHLEKSTREMFKCQVCRRTFASRPGLQYHIRVSHEDRRDFACQFCEKMFANSSNLRRHVDVRHAANKEQIHSCDKCEYKSHSKFNLVEHTRRHNVANWRECYFCKKQFATFQMLVRHCGRIHCLEK